MRKIFIADAHLRNPTDDNYRMLLRFLVSLERNTESLFILGDLFEFWVGYPQFLFPKYLPVLEQLRRLVECGTRIVYFEGNHDFHMGPYFTTILKAEIHRGPAIIPMEGKRVLLCHGDQINHRDYGYRLLRGLLHNHISRVLIPLVPVALTSSIAERMSQESSRKHHGRSHHLDYPAIIRSFAYSQFALECDMVITGHFHLPFLEQSGPGNEKTLVSLGDWISHYSYGELTDGTLALKTFP